MQRRDLPLQACKLQCPEQATSCTLDGDLSAWHVWHGLSVYKQICCAVLHIYSACFKWNRDRHPRHAFGPPPVDMVFQSVQVSVYGMQCAGVGSDGGDVTCVLSDGRYKACSDACHVASRAFTYSWCITQPG